MPADAWGLSRFVPVQGRPSTCRVGGCPAQAVSEVTGLCRAHSWRLGKRGEHQQSDNALGRLPVAAAALAGAACAGMGPSLFFPPRGDPAEGAKAVCRACVVRQECLRYALENRERFGIWGGLSERERARIRRQRRQAGEAA